MISGPKFKFYINYGLVNSLALTRIVPNDLNRITSWWRLIELEVFSSSRTSSESVSLTLYLEHGAGETAILYQIYGFSRPGDYVVRKLRSDGNLCR